MSDAAVRLSRNTAMKFGFVQSYLADTAQAHRECVSILSLTLARQKKRQPGTYEWYGHRLEIGFAEMIGCIEAAKSALASLNMELFNASVELSFTCLSETYDLVMNPLLNYTRTCRSRAARQSNQRLSAFLGLLICASRK